MWHMVTLEALVAHPVTCFYSPVLTENTNYFLHFISALIADTHRQLPTVHSARGSPTTATNDWARVIAVFNSLMFDRNP